MEKREGDGGGMEGKKEGRIEKRKGREKRGGGRRGEDGDEEKGRQSWRILVSSGQGSPSASLH